MLRYDYDDVGLLAKSAEAWTTVARIINLNLHLPAFDQSCDHLSEPTANRSEQAVKSQGFPFEHSPFRLIRCRLIGRLEVGIDRSQEFDLSAFGVQKSDIANI
ncbi:hypothetical protein MELE44368_02805 [Mycolicibacterium elephantis DSM 44368]|uniref:Uncharacterized protein n=1 Tax=Mycolicibacterium elephantis DSM 44368 TaxID=1335622 RepID=A0A439DV94_9MYCO|nr:hypothetical protein MELE44368_02805 [Mycolicibacterium elephantis DSM 44368]